MMHVYTKYRHVLSEELFHQSSFHLNNVYFIYPTSTLPGNWLFNQSGFQLTKNSFVNPASI